VATEEQGTDGASWQAPKARPVLLPVVQKLHSFMQSKQAHESTHFVHSSRAAVDSTSSQVLTHVWSTWPLQWLTQSFSETQLVSLLQAVACGLQAFPEAATRQL